MKDQPSSRAPSPPQLAGGSGRGAFFGCILLLRHLFVGRLAGHEARAAPADSRGGFCTGRAASATMGGAAFERPERAAREGQCFAIIIDEVMTQNFWPIGFGFGFDATRGTRRLHAGRRTCWTTRSRKMVRGCCCERRCPRSPRRTSSLHLLDFRYDVGNRSLPTTFAHRRATRVGAHSRLGLPLALLSVSKAGKERELLVERQGT